MTGSVGQRPGIELPAALRELWEAAGTPTHTEILRALRGQRPTQGAPGPIQGFSRASWAGWRSKTKPQIPDNLELLFRVVEFLQQCAVARDPGFTRQNRRWWQGLVERARDQRGLVTQRSPAMPDRAASSPPDWGRDPSVWPIGKLTASLAVHHLGVNPAITAVLGKPAGPAAAELSSEDSRGLPPYIPREFDAALEAVVDQAIAGRSGMVTLIGGSSTGKTRSCWQQLLRLPPEWRVWHPIHPSEPEALAIGLAHVPAYTVVWLNETQRYLLTGDRAGDEHLAVAVRALLRDASRAPVLVLGTMWPNPWHVLTDPVAEGEPDPHRNARGLLRTTGIPVPSRFTDSELEVFREKAAGDARLGEVARKVQDGQIAQYLAAGPALVDRYLTADPVTRAVLDVAVDALRMGHGPMIPHSLLAEVAAEYLTEDEWNRYGDEDWLEKALVYAAVPVHGARAALTRVRERLGNVPGSTSEPTYRLADYLEQFGRHQRRFVIPPVQFWDALCAHAAPADLIALAEAAHIRGLLRIAARLYERAAGNGNAEAMLVLSQALHRAGDKTGAHALIRRAAGTGNARALYMLAEESARRGDKDSAASLYETAAAAGSAEAMVELAWARERVGDEVGREALLLSAADAGECTPLIMLAEERARAGDDVGAETLATYAARAGDSGGLRSLAFDRMMADDWSAAEQLYLKAVDAGDWRSVHKLTDPLEEAEDWVGAAAVYRRAVESGDPSASEFLILSLAAEGDMNGVLIAVKESIKRGDGHGLMFLAEVAEDTGDHRQAKDIYLEVAAIGGTERLRSLALSRQKAGDDAGAEELYQIAADVGDVEALHELVARRERAGDHDGARFFRQRLIACGSAHRIRVPTFGWEPDGTESVPWKLPRTL